MMLLSIPAINDIINLKGFVMPAFIDLTGERFGRLTVLERGKNNNSGKVRWLCNCDCGNKILCNRNELRSRDTRSCGCYKLDKLTNEKTEKLYPTRKRKAKETKTITEEERYLSFVNWFFEKINKTNDCWLWTASKDKDGYGNFTFKTMTRAHQFSYLIHKGIIPKGNIICHTCDNPGCVNPEHLYAGTHQTNSDDKMSRGRWKTYKVGATT